MKTVDYMPLGSMVMRYGPVIAFSMNRLKTII
jgi:hypothetical protein